MGKSGILSTYEFIYSFRDSVDANFPKAGSESFIEALEMLKKLKNEISSGKKFILYWMKKKNSSNIKNNC